MFSKIPQNIPYKSHGGFSPAFLMHSNKKWGVSIMKNINFFKNTPN
jgi:hypothetical protein